MMNYNGMFDMEKLTGLFSRRISSDGNPDFLRRKLSSLDPHHHLHSHEDYYHNHHINHDDYEIMIIIMMMIMANICFFCAKNYGVWISSIFAFLIL